jgi:glycine cleavage system H protein
VVSDDNLRFTQTHEWVRLEGDLVTIGITEYAVEQLGDVVYIELPKVGVQLNAGDVFGDIESVKAVSDLYAPVSGEVVEVNEELQQQPELVNAEPLGAGWMIRLRPSDPSQLERLMTREQYQHYIAEQQ